MFKDRNDAGERLAQRFIAELSVANPVVVGLPRGGLPVADRVSRRCNAPLDILVVRKIGVPGHEELAAGAIAPGGIILWNDSVIRQLRLPQSTLNKTKESEQKRLAALEQEIRTVATPPINLEGRRVVLVDDGVATGATMRAAIRAVQLARADQVLVALPVCPLETCEAIMSEERCRVLCLETVSSDSFGSVGEWYQDFSQVETSECRRILEKNRSDNLSLAAKNSTTIEPAANRDQSPHQL